MKKRKQNDCGKSFRSRSLGSLRRKILAMGNMIGCLYLGYAINQKKEEVTLIMSLEWVHLCAPLKIPMLYSSELEYFIYFYTCSTRSAVPVPSPSKNRRSNATDVDDKRGRRLMIQRQNFTLLKYSMHTYNPPLARSFFFLSLSSYPFFLLGLALPQPFNAWLFLFFF